VNAGGFGLDTAIDLIGETDRGVTAPRLGSRPAMQTAPVMAEQIEGARA